MSRVAQSDAGAERAVLGAVILDNRVLDEVADLIEPEDFFSWQHAAIFAAMRALSARGEPVDTITLRAELAATGKLERAGGEAALLSLNEVLPNTDAAEAYAKRVRSLATVRAMVLAATKVVARGGEPIEDVDAFLDEAEAAMHAVAIQRRQDARSGTMRELVPRVLEEMLERPGAGEVRGAPTGIALLDKAISGLKPGELVVVAGRPGMGKSAYAGAAALSVTRATGLPVLVWTGEMRREAWVERMLVSESQVQGDVIRAGRWSRNDWENIERAARDLVDRSIVIDDTPSLSVWQLRSKARRLRAREGLALIVVDYLQLMRSGERFGSREQEVAAVSRSLKGLALELNLPVLALAQLNRTTERSADKRPTMADLRESGQIEQDADAILMLYREGYYDEDAARSIAEIIIAKQRAGRTGTIKAYFDPDTVRWGNLSSEDAPPAPFEPTRGGTWDPPGRAERDDFADFDDEGPWR